MRADLSRFTFMAAEGIRPGSRTTLGSNNFEGSKVFWLDSDLPSSRTAHQQWRPEGPLVTAARSTWARNRLRSRNLWISLFGTKMVKLVKIALFAHLWVFWPEFGQIRIRTDPRVHFFQKTSKKAISCILSIFLEKLRIQCL